MHDFTLPVAAVAVLEESRAPSHPTAPVCKTSRRDMSKSRMLQEFVMAHLFRDPLPDRQSHQQKSILKRGPRQKRSQKSRARSKRRFVTRAAYFVRGSLSANSI